MAKYCVVGRGFLGSALAKRLGDTTTYPTKDTKKLFYMGGANHPDFDANPDYWAGKIISEFVYIRDYCREHGIKFIYASSALAYEPEKPFGAFKLSLEGIAGEGTLGLRIFPVTGPGGHTVIEEWREQIKNDIRPTIWGDGTQTRDFVHIDDAVQQIIDRSDEFGVIDIGTSNPKNFNLIFYELTKELGKDIKPIYSPAPDGYVKDGVKFKHD